jgi:hypothetical protein
MGVAILILSHCTNNQVFFLTSQQLSSFLLARIVKSGSLFYHQEIELLAQCPCHLDFLRFAVICIVAFMQLHADYNNSSLLDPPVMWAMVQKFRAFTEHNVVLTAQMGHPSQQMCLHIHCFYLSIWQPNIGTTQFAFAIMSK